ncbi:MAG: DUF4230 domain-containing protein [Verrucomicrobiota bacterium]|jgi:hypothetical protein
MLKKAITVFAPIAAILALCLFFGAYSRTGGLFRNPLMANTATLLRQVQTLSQLVTVKYVLQKIVDVQDVKWYGDNRVLLIAHGIIKAGINLDNLQPSDIQVAGKEITVTLPPPAITDVYLDDQNTQVYERSTGVLRAFDKDLEQNARKQAVEELRLLAIKSDILKDAQDRAQAQLTALFLQIGFTGVQIKTR